jgi:phage terminase large subunit GpA-like protein
MCDARFPMPQSYRPSSVARCQLHLRGGKAAKNYRRITVDCVYYDETDGFDRDIEKEGSAFRLGDKRIEGATFPKSVAGSTPKLKGFSLIEDREHQADVRFQYFIRCPHCDEEHTLDWGGKDARHGMKWTDGDPETVGHVCPHCGVCITQAEYLAAWRGRWRRSTVVMTASGSTSATRSSCASATRPKRRWLRPSTWRSSAGRPTARRRPG